MIGRQWQVRDGLGFDLPPGVGAFRLQHRRLRRHIDRFSDFAGLQLNVNAHGGVHYYIDA
jgi:hypothetical protein